MTCSPTPSSWPVTPKAIVEAESVPEFQSERSVTMAMSREQYQERAKAYGRIVAKAWGDEDFKQRLLADPKATLQAEGLSFPEGAEVRVLESTDQRVYLPLLPKPAGLSIEALSGMAGGYSFDNCDSYLCPCV